MFKKNLEKKEQNNNVPIIALFVHAAKIDENYTDNEKEIIKKIIMELNGVNLDESQKILKIAEGMEEKSNQIVKFTQEIKKYSMEDRLKIIEIIWKIVYSDGTSDSYETNLIRRVCGLLYISDKDNGIIKTKVKNLLNKI
jgi:uncharacterized tellurite resistance protein B-like protein